MYYVNDRVAFGGFRERSELDQKSDASWYVVNVSGRSMDGDYVHVPLNDGAYDGGNSAETFARAVDAVRRGLRNKEKVFVHCALGQSRSVSVLATALAKEQDREFDDVRDELMEIRGSFTEPAPSLQSKGRAYLNEE